MTDSTRDQWAQWLLQRRFGGNSRQQQKMLERLSKVRDHVLQQVVIKQGETLLDVGCGDGLIAFGALDYVGDHGKVIFSDISQDLLDHCYALAQQIQVLDRCQFLRTSAQGLDLLEDQSVDIVTTRSVLIYVSNKQQAFQQFYRVLKPGGRLSIFEPINSFAYPEQANRLFGYDVTPITHLVQKMQTTYGQNDTGSMGDFDERDLFMFAERAGFPEVHLEVHTEVIQGTPEKDSADGRESWEIFLRSSPNPLVPTFEEVMQRALTPEEVDQLTSYLRPLVEKNQKEERSSIAYLWARKH